MNHQLTSLTSLPLLFSGGMVLIVVVGVLLIIALSAYSYFANKKRREELVALASRNGWTYAPGKNSRLVGRWGQIDLFQKGSNRYAENVITGRVDGLPFWLFDYHYETYTHDKNGRQTHHHWATCCLMMSPVAFPYELKVRPETFLDKLASAVGFRDINFESAEFSRKFRVTASDRKFAYDVIHPRMMEFLLRHHQLVFEIEANALMVTSGNGRHPPANWEYLQQTATSILRQLPDYLLAQFRQTPGGS